MELLLLGNTSFGCLIPEVLLTVSVIIVLLSLLLLTLVATVLSWWLGQRVTSCLQSITWLLGSVQLLGLVESCGEETALLVLGQGTLRAHQSVHDRSHLVDLCQGIDSLLSLFESTVRRLCPLNVLLGKSSLSGVGLLKLRVDSGQLVPDVLDVLLCLNFFALSLLKLVFQVLYFTVPCLNFVLHLRQFFLCRHPILNRSFQCPGHLSLDFCFERCLFLIDDVSKLPVLCLQVLAHLFPVSSLTINDLLAGADRFFGRLQAFHKEPNHLIFCLRLWHRLHDLKLALQVSEVLVVFCLLEIHFLLGHGGRRLVAFTRHGGLLATQLGILSVDWLFGARFLLG